MTCTQSPLVCVSRVHNILCTWWSWSASCVIISAIHGTSFTANASSMVVSKGWFYRWPSVSGSSSFPGCCSCSAAGKNVCWAWRCIWTVCKMPHQGPAHDHIGLVEGKVNDNKWGNVKATRMVGTAWRMIVEHLLCCCPWQVHGYWMCFLVELCNPCHACMLAYKRYR